MSIYHRLLHTVYGEPKLLTGTRKHENPIIWGYRDRGKFHNWLDTVHVRRRRQRWLRRYSLTVRSRRNLWANWIVTIFLLAGGLAQDRRQMNVNLRDRKSSVSVPRHSAAQIQLNIPLEEESLSAPPATEWPDSWSRAEIIMHRIYIYVFTRNRNQM